MAAAKSFKEKIGNSYKNYPSDLVDIFGKNPLFALTNHCFYVKINKILLDYRQYYFQENADKFAVNILFISLYDIHIFSVS